jgi:hypothetical protein
MEMHVEIAWNDRGEYGKRFVSLSFQTSANNNITMITTRRNQELIYRFEDYKGIIHIED